MLLHHLRVGEVPRGEKMLCSGTDPESYITEYVLVYEDKVDSHPGNTPKVFEVGAR